MRRYLLLMSLLLSFSHVIAQTKNIEQIKNTAEKLMNFLDKNDTLSILKLHHNYSLYLDKDFDSKKEYSKIADDCRSYQEIINRHKTPSKDDFIAKKGHNDFPELEINFFNEEDSVLQLKSCKLIIVFNPFKYGITDKIFTYYLKKENSNLKTTKIIEAPTIIVDQQ